MSPLILENNLYGGTIVVGKVCTIARPIRSSAAAYWYTIREG
jgi:hypothetical protein